MERYGVPPLPEDEQNTATGGLLSWSHKGAQPLMNVAFGHKTRLIANALGPAPDYMVEHAHEKHGGPVHWAFDAVLLSLTLITLVPTGGAYTIGNVRFDDDLGVESGDLSSCGDGLR